MRLLWKVTMKSCIYTGHVGHRRYEPVGNRFRYSLFMMYLDLSELDQLFRGKIFWSMERPNIAWFRRRDYLGDPDLPLDTAIRNLVKRRLDISIEGPIRMLTHLRYFGYIFNPVTFYYSFDRSDSRVEAITADITNTPWGDRHSYLLDASDRNSSADEMHFRFGKNFHVSPFMDMDMEYDWRFSARVRPSFSHAFLKRRSNWSTDSEERALIFTIRNPNPCCYLRRHTEGRQPIKNEIPLNGGATTIAQQLGPCKRP